MAQASCCIASLLSVCGHLTRPIHVFDYCPHHSIAFVAPPIRHMLSPTHPFSSLTFRSLSHSPRFPCSHFIVTPPSPPPPLPRSHQENTESDAQAPSLTSPMSTLLSSCPHSGFLSGSVSAWIPSLMGPHHFRQLQFVSVDKQRCGAAMRTQLKGIVD